MELPIFEFHALFSTFAPTCVAGPAFALPLLVSVENRNVLNASFIIPSFLGLILPLWIAGCHVCSITRWRCEWSPSGKHLGCLGSHALSGGGALMSSIALKHTQLALDELNSFPDSVFQNKNRLGSSLGARSSTGTRPSVPSRRSGGESSILRAIPFVDVA